MTDLLIDNLEELWLVSDDDICCDGVSNEECDAPAVYTAIWSGCCPQSRRRTYYCEPCFNAWYDPWEGEHIAICMYCDEELVIERYFRIK